LPTKRELLDQRVPSEKVAPNVARVWLPMTPPNVPGNAIVSKLVTRTLVDRTVTVNGEETMEKKVPTMTAEPSEPPARLLTTLARP
jgi:hypothetical protein